MLEARLPADDLGCDLARELPGEGAAELFRLLAPDLKDEAGVSGDEDVPLALFVFWLRLDREPEEFNFGSKLNAIRLLYAVTSQMDEREHILGRCVTGIDNKVRMLI